MPHNILFFGETGVGKSSIINMLLGSDKAKVSNDAAGCTATTTSYAGEIMGEQYYFWDTIGLNEGEKGTMPDTKAASTLYHHLRDLSKSGGVSLLVFCMRGPRVTAAGHKNWVLFRDIICGGKVPSVIAVTHLDAELDTWWSKNENAFHTYQIFPDRQVRRYPGGTHVHADKGVACITATRGVLKRGYYTLEEEYDESTIKLKRLVYESHLAIPWKVNAVAWFQDVVVKIDRTFLLRWMGPIEKVERVTGRGIFKMMELWDVSEEEAKNIAKTLEETARPRQPNAPRESGFSCVMM